MQNAWSRFDELSNVQTASFLLALLVAMLGTAACLLVISVALIPAPLPRQPVPSATEAPSRTALQVERSDPVLARALTLPSTVHLRAEPTTAAQSLAALPQHTELELLDDPGSEHAVWRHVRTKDGREGWIIATALD